MTASLEDLIAEAAGTLERAGVPDARREASSLVAVAIGRDRAFLFAHPEYAPSGDELALIREAIARRASREPFHFITGEKEFYGLEFEVGPGVLIPRPETELLVDRTLRCLAATPDARFCEVGVGSGCISVAMLTQLDGTSAVALDISPDALAIASRNAARHRVGRRLDLRRSDVFSALGPDERFDLIVSNPPYVPAADLPGLEPEVRDHEPHVALTDGRDGLSIIRRIVAEAPTHLYPGGTLALEIGIGQAEAVTGLFDTRLWKDPSVDPDLQDIPRIISSSLRS